MRDLILYEMFSLVGRCFENNKTALSKTRKPICENEETCKMVELAYKVAQKSKFDIMAFNRESYIEVKLIFDDEETFINNKNQLARIIRACKSLNIKQGEKADEGKVVINLIFDK